MTLLASSLAYDDSSKLYSSYQYTLIKDLNISLSDTMYNPTTTTGEISYTMSLCYGNLSRCQINPSSLPLLWVTPFLDDIPKTVSIAQALNIPVIIFVTDDEIPFYYIEQPYTTLVFTTSIKSGHTISRISNGASATVVYGKSSNCEITYIPLVIMTGILAVSSCYIL